MLDAARFREGFVASFALMPSVFAYGSVFGGLAVQTGLRPVEVWVMSVLVFAGAAQFVAVPMIGAGASPLAVILTTYVVNMRHYLMAATLAPAFRNFPRRWLALVAHFVNDESFAIAVARSSPPNPSLYLGSALGAAFLSGMTVGTLLGGTRRGAGALGARLCLPRGLPGPRGRPAPSSGRLARGRWKRSPGPGDRGGPARHLAHRDRRGERQRVGSPRGRSLARARPVRTTIALTILGMAVATYLTRAPLLLMLARRPLRPRLQLWLRLIPLAVLPALAVPMVLAPQGQLTLGPDNPRLWGALIVVGLVAVRANLLVSVAIAVAVAVIRALG